MIGNIFCHTHHIHYQIASIYAAVGETEKAMGWLERTAYTGFPVLAVLPG
jgi:hypothetical protein